jgi:hypothetical protein
MMSSLDCCLSIRKGLNLFRFVLIANFIVMACLIGPGSSHAFYVDLKRSGLAVAFVTSVQVWLVGSTVIATLLFARRVWIRKFTKFPEGTSAFSSLDLALFIAWWSVVVVLFMYALSMGAGG